MKSLLFCLALTIGLSSNISAKTLATKGFANLIPAGVYTGTGMYGACSVSLTINSDSVAIYLKDEQSLKNFFVVDMASTYSVNEEKKEIAATTSLGFPKYSMGGSKNLYVKGTDTTVEFYISEVLLDHHGEDASSYASCTISL